MIFSFSVVVGQKGSVPEILLAQGYDKLRASE